MHVYGVAEARTNFKKILDEASNGEIVQIGHRGRPEVQLTTSRKPALSETSLCTLARGLGIQQAESIYRHTKPGRDTAFLFPDSLAADVIQEFFHTSSVRPCVEFVVSLLTHLHKLREENDAEFTFEVDALFHAISIAAHDDRDLEAWLLSSVKPTVTLFVQHLMNVR